MSSENEVFANQEPNTLEIESTGPPLPEQDSKVVDGPECRSNQETDHEESTKEIRIALTKRLIESTVCLLDGET